MAGATLTTNVLQILTREKICLKILGVVSDFFAEHMVVFQIACANMDFQILVSGALAAEPSAYPINASLGNAVLEVKNLAKNV